MAKNISTEFSGGNSEEFIIKTNEPEYEPSDCGLGYEFFHCMKDHGKKIAQYVVETNEVDTYEDLHQRCIRTALKMMAIAITKDDIVTLCTHNHVNSCVPFIAAQFLRNRVASLDPSLSVEDSAHLLNQVKPKIIFASEDAVMLIENALKLTAQSPIMVVFGKTKKYIPFEEFLQPSNEEKTFQPVTDGSNKDTAVILFSSGTTGLPKGICVSHYALMVQTVECLKYWNTGTGCALSNYYMQATQSTQSVLLSFTSLYWISGVGMTNRCIFSGNAKLVCKEFQGEQWWQLVEKYRVTTAFLPPSQAAEMLQAKPSTDVDTSSLKLFFTGSCPVTVTLMKNLKKALPTANIWQAYGQTEMSGIVTSFYSLEPNDCLQQNRKPLSCGKPIKGIWYKVVNPDTEEILGPNSKGELRFKSKFIMNGYHNMETTNAFDADGWLKSGDIGYYDDDYCFFVVDRIKEMFKYKSWHIVPAMLENVLCSHPAVKEAVIVGIPHDVDGEHPMGLVVLNKAFQANTEEIEKYVEHRVLERQRLRAGVKIVESIPKTCTGKIQRRIVREMLLKNNI